VTREARNAPGDFEIYVAHSSPEMTSLKVKPAIRARGRSHSSARVGHVPAALFKRRSILISLSSP